MSKPSSAEAGILSGLRSMGVLQDIWDIAGAKGVPTGG